MAHLKTKNPRLYPVAFERALRGLLSADEVVFGQYYSERGAREARSLFTAYLRSCTAFDHEHSREIEKHSFHGWVELKPMGFWSVHVSKRPRLISEDVKITIDAPRDG